MLPCLASPPPCLPPCLPPPPFPSFGITNTVDQLFDAPPIVKAALANISGTTSTYVGGE